MYIIVTDDRFRNVNDEKKKSYRSYYFVLEEHNRLTYSYMRLTVSVLFNESTIILLTFLRTFTNSGIRNSFSFLQRQRHFELMS